MSSKATDEEKSALLGGISKEQPEQAKKGLLAFGAVSIAIAYYAACSSTMLVINKVTIYFVPVPTAVLVVQLAVTVAVVKSGALLGLLQADELEWAKVKKFCFVIVGFLGTIYANIKVLQHANVETFIVFRSSTPLLMSLMDYVFLGRALPSGRSVACLLVLLAGALGYVLTDSGFQVNAYAWVAVWYAFFTFDTVYVKHMCESVAMTNWGRVYYTNFLALFILGPLLPALNEQAVLANVQWSFGVIFPLVLSCVVGVCMSHASYFLRENTSATLFTIVGILCKIATVIINLLIWDNHASFIGIAFLSLCVVAGTFYQQAPKRSELEKAANQG